MKKLKTKLAVIGLALAGLTFIPLANTNHDTSSKSTLGAYQYVLRANDVSSEEVDNTTTEDDNEATKEEYVYIKVDGKDVKVPKKVLDYYNTNVRDKYMFGISLGSAIGLAIAVIGWLAVYIKNTHLIKNVKKSNDENKAIVNVTLSEMNLKINEYENIIKEKDLKFEQLSNRYEETLDKYSALIDDTSKKFDEGVQVLENYAKIDKKVDAMLEIQKEFVANETDVVNGTAERVNSIVNEVK